MQEPWAQHPKKPHAFIRWKGTSVCADVYCRCGVSGHIDADFFYFYKCPGCGQMYRTGWYVDLYPVESVPETASGAAIHVGTDPWDLGETLNIKEWE